MQANKETVISRIKDEIDKIDKKTNTIYFFVIDTKGNPSGSLSYIYNLALILSKNGYNIGMLYQEDEEFVGVKDWLGDEFANLPHYDITSGDVSVSASDILFIPELFSNLMIQTKQLPCKRIVILQNYDFVLEQMPMASQWGDFGIMEAIVNTEANEELIKDIFPYVKTTVIDPYIENYFGETQEPKKMIINIISKNQTDINKIIKPFYWKYPMYKWVSFRDLRGFPKKDYAQLLREAAITIWVDDDSNFGYSALEAIKSGAVVIAKVPKQIQSWMKNEDKSLNDSCIWFDSYQMLHKIIASVVRAWITDNIPSELQKQASIVNEKYTVNKTTEQILTYISGVLENRKTEMESLINYVKNEEKE